MFGKILALAVFCLLFFGTAYAQPGIPHQFYGYVTVDGNPADNANIVAIIDGDVFGSTTSSNGTYGFSPYIFYVENPNSNEDQIEFFLSGSADPVATHTFETGAHTRLDLYIGNAPVCGDTICNTDEDADSCPGDCTEEPEPYCGDNSCNGGEACETCEADCGSCGGAPGPSGPGNSSGPTGGASTSKLTVEIDGSCVNEEIVVTVLNTVGNPARGATVRAVKDRKSAGNQESDDDGKAFFTFSETGEYYIYATKSNYAQNTSKLEVTDCVGGETAGVVDTGEEGGGTGNLCNNVNCDDSNPCTTEYCATKTGHCVYENQAESLSCGGENTCKSGVCTEPEPETIEEETPADSPTGFVGLSGGQTGGAGLIVIALIGLVLLVATKKKKKK